MNKVTAMYIRLSKEDIDCSKGIIEESNSISNQRELILNYLKKEGLDNNITEYVDDGYTGTDTNRPGLHDLMCDVKKEKISTIIVKDFSRLGRDYLEIGNYLEYIFPMLNVRFISINDRFDSINSKGITGGMTVGIKNIVNAMYCKDCSKKVASSLRNKAKDGEYVLSYAPYGYIKDPENPKKLIIDREAAIIVQDIFKRVAKGEKTMDVVRCLNKNNVPSIHERMKLNGIKHYSKYEKNISGWNANAIRKIIKNEVYLGKLLYGKTKYETVYVDGQGSKKIKKIMDKDKWIVIENAHEPIITEELFEKANNELKKNTIRNKTSSTSTNTHKFSNYFYCPYCKRKLKMSHNKKYYCRYAADNYNLDCKKVKINRIELEETILESTKKMMQLSLQNIENKKKNIKRERKSISIPQLENKIVSLKKEKIKAYNKYHDKRLSKEEYMEKAYSLSGAINDIKNTIEEEKARVEQEKNITDILNDNEVICNEIIELKKYDNEILNKVIQKVFVYADDKIEVVWKMDNLFLEKIGKNNR